MLECCFHVPVDLQPNQTISVLLKFKNFGFAVPMYKFDFVGCRIYDITEKLIIMVVAPDKHTIRVLPEPQMQKGFRVFNFTSEEEQPDELTRIARPEEIGGREIYWHVDYPIMGNAYWVRYQVIKP